MATDPFIKTGTVLELGLMVAEITGQCGTFLPLAGSHGNQLGIVFGGSWCAHETWHLTAEARKWIASKFQRSKPKTGESANGPAA